MHRPRSTQPGRLSVGRRNEYQRKPGAVMLCGWWVKAGMVREWVAGKTVIPLLSRAISEHFSRLTGERYTSVRLLLLSLTEFWSETKKQVDLSYFTVQNRLPIKVGVNRGSFKPADTQSRDAYVYAVCYKLMRTFTVNHAFFCWMFVVCLSVVNICVWRVH